MNFEVDVSIVKNWLPEFQQPKRAAVKKPRRLNHCGHRTTEGYRNDHDHQLRIAAHRARVQQECAT